LAASALALTLSPLATLAQSECEQIRRDCADYCRYGPVSPEKGRDCKQECRKKVEQCQRGMRAAEGYPTYGAPGGYPGAAALGYGAPAPAATQQAPLAQQPPAPAAAPAYGYGAPGYGYGAPGYGYGAPGYYGAPYGAAPYGGYGAAPYAAPQAPASNQEPMPSRPPQ
jgi:hypothetical protein